MSCVNDKYTPDELESIFIWDCLCEAIPLTTKERREIRERDSALSNGKRAPAAKVAPTKAAEHIPTEDEQKQRKREQKRRWREANKERIRAYDIAYREKNRDSINERQREYDRAKQAQKKQARASAQP